MSTSGSFTPPAVPECPYEPRMTRAQALALRAAGGLRENCVVVITDGPTIGTAGNTSPTEIELNPVSPTEFGTAARVHTSFAASAWTGVYDIDLGTAGSLTRLTDDWNNHVEDPDADAPTVHGAFPWHLGGTSVRDNEVKDSTLTGWDQLVSASGNYVHRATVDVSGGWTFNDNRIDTGTVQLQSTGFTARAFTRNVLRSASRVTVHPGASGTVATFTGNEFLDGYILEVQGTNTGNVSIGGSRFENRSAAAMDARIDLRGTGQTTFNNARSVAPPNAVIQYDLQGQGAGNVSVSGDFLGGRIVRDPAATAALGVGAGCRILSVITQGPGATGAAMSLSGTVSHAPGTVINQLGPGGIVTNSVELIGGGVTIGVGATRGLNLTGTVIQSGQVVQNRTGGTGVDQLSGSYVEGQGNVVTLNGAVDPGVSQTVLNNSRVANLSTLTLTDPAGSPSVVVQATSIDTGADVTGTGTGLVSDCRFSGGCVVDLGAFGHQGTIVDGPFTKTLTASNVGRLCNKAYDDVIGV